MNRGLWSLPDFWTLSRIDRVAKVSARIGWKALTASEYKPEGYAFLATPNIKSKKIDFENVNYISEFRYNESPDLKLRVGDVLLAKDGNTLGICNIVRDVPRPATVNGSVAVIRAFGVDPNFLRYVIDSSLVQDHIESVKEGMGVPHLFQKDIKRIPVPLPSPEEQRRIAEFLDSEVNLIDRILAVRRQQIGSLEDRFAVALTDRFIPEVMKEFPKSRRWPWLPRDLPAVKLGWYARVQTGVTVDSSRTPSEDDVEVPYLRVANVQGGKVDLNEVKSMTLPSYLARKSTLRYGDVVMTEANGNPDNLGRGAVWRNEIEGMIHQNHIFSIRLNQSFILPEYLSFILSSMHGRRYFRFTSNQVGIATTSSSKVLSFPVPKIPVSMQRSVVDECEKLLNLHTESTLALNRQIDLLEERKRALITAAVTGQIDVTTARGADLS